MLLSLKKVSLQIVYIFIKSIGVYFWLPLYMVSLILLYLWLFDCMNTIDFFCVLRLCPDDFWILKLFVAVFN